MCDYLMNWRGATTGIVVVAAVGLVVYDVAAAASREKRDTISEVIADGIHAQPIIAAVLGGLLVHFCGWAVRPEGH